MRIVWTELAVQDLLAIRRYIADRNPTHRTDVRRLVVAGTIYSIPYRVTGETIEILEVFDSRRHAPRTDLDADPS
jgi:toxin ParE1/3/4